MTLFDELKARGLVAQTTDEDKVRELINGEGKTFYIGFDPTADSLHVGHFVAMVVMAHMQRHGHRPIALFGGGTGMIGDPTGKTDMRKMLTREEIDYNVSCFVKQMSTLVDFSDGKAIMANNGDWLLDLNYIDFIRDIGVHFSVNRMLAAECYKQRMERGLTFFELNYMLMQSYDFYKLHQDYDCIMELGGDDQWSNIIGGVELCRRKLGDEVYGMTFNLLLKSDGKKMGKTEGGAVWLDPNKTSPYDFYQYWRNVDDADVITCLKMLTFVPLEKIAEYEKLSGSELNSVKAILAYELTKMIHGKEEADKADAAAKALFGAGQNTDDMPTTNVDKSLIDEGYGILDLMLECGLIPSKGEGRRLIQGGGVSLNDQKVVDPLYKVTAADFEKGYAVIKKGKKV
ncbi:MAG: tyrosine--tRNA ligase, partial [Oscillospiraceae bacterium]|nr:tyrosine--tRNA ligase [Candidatus Equicaccousia limihippi]